MSSSNNPNLITMIMSVLAAFFGVQTSENRKRDFEKGNPVAFIIIGIILIIAFLAIIYAVGSMVVPG